MCFIFSPGRTADGFHLRSVLRRRLPSIDNCPQLHILTSAGEEEGQWGDHVMLFQSRLYENGLYLCVNNLKIDT